MLCACWVLVYWFASVKYEIAGSERSIEAHQGMPQMLVIESLPPLALLFIFVGFPRRRFIGPGGLLACVSLALTSYLLLDAYNTPPNKNDGWVFAMTIIYGYIGAVIATLIAIWRRG
jgi:hypothetical protein